MELQDFYNSVEKNKDLRGVGVEKDESGRGFIIIEHKPSKMMTKIPAQAIEKAEWNDIQSVLTCERDPVVLQHITRVVGYFSRINNWNTSKIGELKDRHKGQYAVA